MAVFEYRARARNGGMIHAQMDAASPAVVAARLAEVGATPLRIAHVPESTDPVERFFKRFERDKVDIEDLIVFTRQMYRLSKAGIPIVQAIKGLAESTRVPALARALTEIADSLQSGRELSQSMQLHPRIFPAILINVVRVGEETGNLEEGFERISAYLELDLQTRRRLKSATRYPVMVIVAIVAAMVVINAFVIPAFAQVFEGFGAELPWATRVLIASSNFFVNYWHVLAVLSFGAIVGVRMWRDTDDGRLVWDRYKLRIPVVGDIIERATIARYARSFSMTFSAGVPVLQTLRTVALAAGNAWVTQRIMAMSSSIERGETFRAAAGGCGLFDPLALQMLGVGEEAGDLADMHREIAESYESEVDYQLRQLTDMIEPLMIVAVGGIVLVLALGVYLPMWDLSTAIK